MHSAIFLDRDGTVSEEVGYMYNLDLYKPFSWAGQALKQINDSGMKAVLITNQSGIGRGYFPESLVHAVHDVLIAELARSDARLDGIYYCPHQPDTKCECRKPKPGMILRAAHELHIDVSKSFMIGDKYVDVEAAWAAGTKSILVRTGYGAEELEIFRDAPHQPHFVADNLLHAVESILSGKVK